MNLPLVRDLILIYIYILIVKEFIISNLAKELNEVIKLIIRTNHEYE